MMTRRTQSVRESEQRTTKKETLLLFQLDQMTNKNGPQHLQSKQNQHTFSKLTRNQVKATLHI